jgi:hypothetical protein
MCRCRAVAAVRAIGLRATARDTHRERPGVLHPLRRPVILGRIRANRRGALDWGFLLSVITAASGGETDGDGCDSAEQGEKQDKTFERHGGFRYLVTTHSVVPFQAKSTRSTGCSILCFGLFMPNYGFEKARAALLSESKTSSATARVAVQ